MEVVLLQFALCGLNLLGAKSVKESGGNPVLNYFVAGMTFGFGINKLLEIYLK